MSRGCFSWQDESAERENCSGPNYYGGCRADGFCDSSRRSDTVLVNGDSLRSSCRARGSSCYSNILRVFLFGDGFDQYRSLALDLWKEPETNRVSRLFLVKLLLHRRGGTLVELARISRTRQLPDGQDFSPNVEPVSPPLQAACPHQPLKKSNDIVAPGLLAPLGN